MTSERGCKKDKNQNIQVFVRLRPLNQRERDIKSLGVIEVVNNREVVVRHSQQTTYTKKFTFDKAFAPSAKQFEVYQDVVSPLIEEVLNGYNCTVFAYGQTGTGKTHTMVGENTEGNTNWQNDPLAGIIPRALSQLFDELRISNTEYTVRVSYLELYNEELFDLLSTSEDNSKLRIYEDITRKGSNIVNGLEEITVYNKNEVYKIMAQGQERKKVASTLMNAQSSRSHTVFTIVVHMKENSQEGEELVKIGKLNLVDLAGSENISKAGSDNPAKRERARECVNINQSLLTLGRVITALVERHPHIPYRESKLTRILQESLGGRTKTSIIATISPGHKDLEETMSTLEYAHRAKNIQNKPEINQKMTKKAILKEYAEEIDKLKRDLQAARDKNGVYLANETFAELTLKQEEQRKEIQDLLLQKRFVEEERERMENIFKELSYKLERTDRKLNITKNKLQSTKEVLLNTKSLLQSRTAEAEEQRHLVAVHQRTEEELSAQAVALLHTAELASDHLARLHDTVETRRSLESRNMEMTRTFLEKAETLHANRQTILKTFAESLATALEDLRTQTEKHASTNDQIHKRTKDNIDDKIRKITETMDEVRQLSKHSDVAVREAGGSAYHKLRSDVSAYGERLRVALERAMWAVADASGRTASLQLVATVDKFMRQWQSSSCERVTSLRVAHGAYATDAHVAYVALSTNARRQRDARLARLDANSQRMQARAQEMTSFKKWWDGYFQQAALSLQEERAEFSSRLERWVDEERRLFEERIRAHVSAETEVFNRRFEEKMQVMEKEKEMLDKQMECQMEMHQAELEAHRKEMDVVEREVEEWESCQKQCDGHLDKYINDLDQGMTAISTDIEAVRGSIVQFVEYLNNQIVEVLHAAKDQLEVEKKEIIESERESEERLVREVEIDRERIAMETKRAVDSLVNNMQVNITATVEELSTVASTMETLMATTASHRHELSSTLDSVNHHFEQFRVETEEAERKQADLQTNYVAKEFKVYAPTGGTPLRQELRYPRALASTSPHERVLAKYRQRIAEARQELECSVIDLDEDSEESAESSSVMSVYEDTASSPTSNGHVVPPPPPPPPPPSMVKSNSDMDIYERMDGKENAERSTLNRKPSKLPAPSSCALKRPLVQRNNSVN